MRALIAFARRLDVTALVLLGSIIISGPVLAQGDPGQNVNIVGLTLDPNDIPDEFYRQQNEPSCAVRPGDSACMICAYNDYRTVDVFGDAWQGISQSCDAGDSWLSRIAPGSPADQVAPIPAAFAADPRLQAIPGMAILNFIAGYRDSNVGVLAIQHWLEVNKEDADHYEPGRITYFADEGTSGRFLDKPDMVAVLDPPNRQTPLTLSTAMENSDLGVITRDYPSGKLYVGYAVFTGSSSIKVLLKVSDDWGQTWRNQALKLSEDQNEVSGLSLTAVGDKVVAIWRRRGDNNNSDAIMYSVISNDGKKATKGEVLAEVCAFDQPTLGGTEGLAVPMVAFRTNDFPWSANDGNNFYAFYSDRGKINGACNPNGRPRIVVHHSSSGSNWSAPVTVDDNVHPDSFQFMPTAFGANGKIQVAWYDTRREAEELAGLLLNQQLPYVADHVDLDLTSAAFVQRKVDVYTTSMTIDQVQADAIPAAVRASQYAIVVEEEGGEYAESETEASFANKKMFKQGTLPFLGDYIAMAARQFREVTNGNNAGKWESNASLSMGNEDFFVAWTDNRDVRGEVLQLEEPLPYSSSQYSAANDGDELTDTDASDQRLLADTAPLRETGPPRDDAQTAEGIDGNDLGTALACSPATAEYERSRDGNIYGSLIKDRVRLFAPTPGKPLSGLQRAFVVAITNAENQDRAYTLSIDDQPCDNASVCRASFRQLPSTPNGSTPAGNEILEALLVPANSTLARTVFVVGSASRQIPITARDSNGTVVSVVQLGDESLLLDPDTCTSGSCGVADAELHNLTLGNLTLGNLDLANQELLNLTLGNLTLGNLTLGNLTLGNLTLGNLTLGNLTLGNLTLGNLTLGNAALANPSLIEIGKDRGGFDDDSSYGELLEWAIDPGNGVDPALLNPALLALTIDDPDELLNLTLGNLTLGNLTLGNLTLGNLTLGNLTLGNAAAPNLTLGNLTLGNLTLGNAAIDDPVLNTTVCPPNSDGSPAECTVSGLAYDDYTYPITNRGNVTTAIDADITVNGDVAATQLIAWTANVTPTSVNCEDILQMDERVRAVVNNPDSVLEVADITKPFEGDISTVAGPGETVFFTMRVFGTPDQLKNVIVSGFTASSQAANCIRINGVVDCSDNLNDGVEKIFLDKAPPVFVALADISAEATGVGGATVNWSPIIASDDVDGDIPADCTIPSGSLFPLGQTLVECFAVDNSANVGAASFTVAVVDTTAPTISAPADVTAEATGNPDSTVAIGTASGADLFGVTITSNAPSAFPLGSTSVLWTAIDGNGNVATATQIVTVVDTTPPMLPSLPDQLDVQATDTAGTPVNWSETAIDIYDGPVAMSCSLNSGSIFAIGGPTSVLCSATDGAGNANSTSFDVTVVDTTPPAVDPVIPPDDFNPGSPYPFELASDANTITVTWPVGVTDADPNLDITCTINGVAYDPESTTFTGNQFTATFEYEFPLGSTPVSCAAEDSSGAITTIPFTVEVLDVTNPVITVPSEPLVIESSTSPAAVDFSGLVSVYDAGYPGTAAVCMPASGSDFAWGDTLVTCNATDGSGNVADSASFTVSVNAAYDIKLFPPKNNARAGSTVPLDWQYLDWNSGNPIDSPAFDVRVLWVKSSDCSGVPDSGSDIGSSGVGDDAGSSDFRYSESSKTWQFSWHTPLQKGYHVVTIVPPGADNPNASTCVRLR